MRIMRAIQKKRISCPICMKLVGWNVRRSSVSSGHPRALNVQSPEENQVSSVSGSCSQPAPSGASVPPPDLARDAPGAQVFYPVEIDFRKAFGLDGNFLIRVPAMADGDCLAH